MGYKLKLCLALLASAAHGPLFAQQSDDEAINENDGDIIVTATRSETLASKTPVSLTAISGAGLEAAAVTDPTKLGDLVPNLAMDRLSNSLQITIRGVTSTDTTEKGDPSAAFMIDGIYIARPHAQEVSFFDIERIEVLRGPQGTLFGRNSTAGVVNLISNKPQDGFDAGVSATYGNYDTRRLNGMINLPVSEDFALRAAVNYDYRDSFLNAGPLVTGRLDPFKNNLSGRLSGRYRWSTGRLIVIGDYAHLGGMMLGVVNPNNFYTRTSTTGVDPIYAPIGDEATRRTVFAPMTFANERNNGTWGFTADFEQELEGGLAVNYIGGFRKFWRDEELPLTSGDNKSAFFSTVDVGVVQHSHELRLSLESGILRAQAGLYYFKENGHQIFNVFGSSSPTPGTTGYNLAIWARDVRAENKAAFAQATLDITPTFRLTGGIRYSHDKKGRVGTTSLCAGANCDAPADRVISANAAERTFSKTTWRLGLDYDLDERSLLYAVVSTGYKAGGFNNGCLVGTGAGCTLSDDGLYYRPESITAYEAGIKYRNMDGSVRLAASAFHYDFQDIQLSQLRNACAGTPCNVTSNAAGAKIDGAEIESAFLPHKNTRIDFALSWLNARYADFIPVPGVNWTGRQLDHAPKWSVSAGIAQTFPLDNGADLIASAKSKFVDKSVLATLGTVNQYPVPSFTRTDLSLTYRSSDRRWEAQAFVNNLEDKVQVTAVFPGAFSSLAFSDPRTFGVRLSWKY